MLAVDIDGFHAHEIRPDAGTSILFPSDLPTASAFFVLAGELVLRLEGDAHVLGPETWAFVPASAEYTLAAGNAPAHLLHIQLPGGSSRNVIIRRAGGDEGEKMTDRPERRLTVLVEADEIAITESRYGAGQRGAPLHVHREHMDAFLVREGEVAFHLRDGSHALPAGTFIVFPPGVVHGFDNDSDAFTRFFNFHVPSLGFVDYLRSGNPCFDQHDPPADGGVDPAAVVDARLSE